MVLFKTQKGHDEACCLVRTNTCSSLSALDIPGTPHDYANASLSFDSHSEEYPNASTCVSLNSLEKEGSCKAVFNEDASTAGIASDKYFVFVYGTLKQNMRNHYLMEQSGAAFAFNAKTVDKLPLVLDTANRYRPCLLNVKGVGHRIEGEVYVVSAEQLRCIDEFERVPAHYQRQSFTVEPILNEATIPEGCIGNQKLLNILGERNRIRSFVYTQSNSALLQHALNLKDSKCKDAFLRCYGNEEAKLYSPRKLESV